MRLKRATLLTLAFLLVELTGRPTASKSSWTIESLTSLMWQWKGLARWEGTAPGMAEAAERYLVAAETPLPIPPHTFIARRFPEAGKGVRNGKHMRIVHRPEDGRLYFLGGDYQGPIGMDSGRNEIYSYSIKDEQWRLEWPFCGPQGSIQPSHPDQVGWVYDTHRKLFWMIPGYMGRDTGKCQQAGSGLVRGQIMTFDPASRTWALAQIPLPYQMPGNHKFAQYDPATDSIIVFFGAGTRYGAFILDLRTRTWTTRMFKGEVLLGREYTAIAPERRAIYVIEPKQAKLYRYDIDRQELVPIADAPRGSHYDSTMLFWDPGNRVLLFPQYFKTTDITMHVYHPDTNQWDLNLPTQQPEGERVRASNGVFDPYQNVLLLFGIRGNEPDASRYMFLYRYQKGPAGR